MKGVVVIDARESSDQLALERFAPIGLAFLFGMYAAFALGAMPPALVFGWINDVLAIVSGLLMLPVAVALHVLLRLAAPRLSRLALMIGIGANGAIVILQSLLVLGALTFAQEIGPVLVAFLFLAAWFVMTGSLGSGSGVLPHGVRMGLLAVTYLFYPIWAFWLGRHLLRLARDPVQRAGSSLPADPGKPSTQAGPGQLPASRAETRRAAAWPRPHP